MPSTSEAFCAPQRCSRVRADHAAGRRTDAELRAAEDEAIRGFVALQESLGFQVVTDGEFRRKTYTSNFTTEGLTGVTAEHKASDVWSYTNAKGHKEPARIPAVHAPIRWNNSSNAGDFAALAGMTRVHPKITLPGPCYIHFRAGRAGISRAAYPDLADFWSDIVTAYCTELEKLAEAGCRYVQLDETSIAKLGDEKIRSALETRGDNWEELLERYIEVINALVTRAPGGMRIGLHLCRGNRMGHWQAEGGYDVVADKLFNTCAIDFFFLEYDSDRAGGFEPLKAMPEHKTVVLGLLSTKIAAIEDEELLLARIRDASRVVGLDRLGISPQCGFSSSDGANTIMNAEQARAKLTRVVEIARKVWGE